jgi:hypothetical protein
MVVGAGVVSARLPGLDAVASGPDADAEPSTSPAA